MSEEEVRFKYDMPAPSIMRSFSLVSGCGGAIEATREDNDDEMIGIVLIPNSDGNIWLYKSEATAIGRALIALASTITDGA
jgi:hypothetical protein